MDPIIGSSLISAGSQLAGGVIQGGANKKEGKRAWRRTKTLNQNQIQWRVKDAKAAGIHPLAALGMSPIGNAVPSTGSVMGDAVANAGSAVAQGVANSSLNKQAVAESQARILEMTTRARANQAEAEFTDQQRVNSLISMFKSPGRPAMNTPFGEVYELPGKPKAPPKYLDPNTRPVSRQHAQMLEDVTPGAMKGEPVVIHGAKGLQIPIDPSWTPGGLVEELIGDAGSFVGFLNLLASLPDATYEKSYPWWFPEKGYKAAREKALQLRERARKAIKRPPSDRSKY